MKANQILTSMSYQAESIEPAKKVASKTSEKKKVSAAFVQDRVGVCMYCGGQMSSATAAGVEVWFCPDDAAVTPKDPSQ